MPAPNFLRTDYITQTAQNAVNAPRNALQMQAMEQENMMRQHAINQFKFKDARDMFEYFLETKDYITLDNYDDALDHFEELGATGIRDLVPAPETFKSEDEFNKWKIGAAKSVEEELKKSAFEAGERRKKEAYESAESRKASSFESEERRKQQAFEAEERRKAQKAITEAKRKAKEGGDKDFEFKPADSNAIKGQIYQLFGGFYNPTTHTYGGLDVDTQTRAQAVQAQAERIYKAGRGALTHAEAVYAAAQIYGVEFPETEIQKQKKTEQQHQQAQSWRQYQTRKPKADMLKKAH